MKITIQGECLGDDSDERGWYCYDLTSDGSTLEELVENAVIGEVDQDGGDLDCYGLEDAPNAIQDAAMRVFEQHLGKLKEAV
jgi:hypothetical protein